MLICAALLLVAPLQRTDTLVVRSAGDLPATAIRRLVVEWKANHDIGDATNSIGNITGMTVGPDGRVYVWDPATPAIWVTGADGAGLKKIGRKGAGPGEYDRVNGIAVRPDGKLVAWDGGNSRLNVYRPDGTFDASWLIVMSGRTYTSGALTADVQNRVLMRWSIQDPADRSQSRPALLGWDITGQPRDTLFVPQYPGDPPLRATSPDGTGSTSQSRPYGTGTRAATSPLGFVVSGPGRPYAVNTMWNGRPVRIERTMTPVAVAREERGEWRAAIEAQMRNTQPGWTWSGSDIPAAKPAYSGLSVGMDGRIWVQLSVESERYTPDPPSVPPQGTPTPVVHFRPKELRWDVFEPDGRYVGRVSGPRQFTPYVMRGNNVWGVLRDEDDVPAIVKMRADFGT